MSVRLSVNISDETEAALKELAGRKDVTVTEIVRRAVSIYKFVEDEVVETDSQLVIENKDKARRREVAFLV